MNIYKYYIEQLKRNAGEIVDITEGWWNIVYSTLRASDVPEESELTLLFSGNIDYVVQLSNAELERVSNEVNETGTVGEDIFTITGIIKPVEPRSVVSNLLNINIYVNCNTRIYVPQMTDGRNYIFSAKFVEDDWAIKNIHIFNSTLK